MPVVQNTALDPGGGPLYPANVTITLIAAPGGHAAGYTGAGTILSTYTTSTDSTGHWTATLVGNADITPANTYYRLSEGGWTSPIVVPASGGPYDMPTLVVAPPTPDPVGITAVQVAADGTVAGSRPQINVVAGTNVSVTAIDNPASNRVDVTVTSTAGGAGPSGTVITETAFGQPDTPGAASTFSRGDHTHGTPPAPTAAGLGALVAADNLSDLPNPATARTNLGLANNTLELVAQTIPPNLAGVEFPINTGTLVFVLVYLPGGQPITSLGAWLFAGGVTPGGVNGLALFTEAGSLVAQTVDMSTAFTGTGWVSGNLAGGPVTPAKGGYYLAALTNFGTAPHFKAADTTTNLPAINGHYPSVFLAAQSSFPASFNPATANLNSGTYYLTAQ